MFATALQSIVMMAELAIRGPEKFQKRVFWKGLEILEEIRHNNRNVIFLVPHGWSVDIPAMLLAAQGKKWTAMFHQQRNSVIDYVWNSVRRKFGGRLTCPGGWDKTIYSVSTPGILGILPPRSGSWS